MKVTVIYPPDNCLNGNNKRTTFHFDVTGSDTTNILETIWRRMNVVTGDADLELPINAKSRSMMVGDIAILRHESDDTQDKYFVCDCIGFKPISRKMAALWEKLSIRDRGVGYEWVMLSAMKAFVNQ